MMKNIEAATKYVPDCWNIMFMTNDSNTKSHSFLFKPQITLEMPCMKNIEAALEYNVYGERQQ